MDLFTDSHLDSMLMFFWGVEKAGNFFDIVSVFIQGVSKKSTHFGFANISAFKTS